MRMASPGDRAAAKHRIVRDDAAGDAASDMAMVQYQIAVFKALGGGWRGGDADVR